jgi:hypothetical protein
MKTTTWMAGTVGFLLTLGAAGAESPWSARAELRTHARITLNSGESAEVTLLLRSKGANPSLGVFDRNSVLLLDGASMGRWVFELRGEGASDASRLSSVYTLHRADGSESLSVTYSTCRGEGRGEFLLRTDRGEAALTEAELLPSYPGGIHPDATSLPESTRKVIRFLSALAFQDLSWGPDPLFVAPLLGTSPEPSKATLQVTSLPVDCAFDAAFGFPCETEERAVQNGKVYVKERLH